jgi:hypothetical protein
MIWVILVAIVVYIIFKFSSDVNKDKYDLRGINLSDKFKVVVGEINQAAYNGNGRIITINNRAFNLYQDGQNQIICFFYGTGHLTITWKYKYFQKEVVHEKIFHDVRNLSIFEQQRMAEIIIGEMTQVIQRHQEDVLRRI